MIQVIQEIREILYGLYLLGMTIQIVLVLIPLIWIKKPGRLT